MVASCNYRNMDVWCLFVFFFGRCTIRQVREKSALQNQFLWDVYVSKMHEMKPFDALYNLNSFPINKILFPKRKEYVKVVPRYVSCLTIGARAWL
jgi:hypothetical protein